MLKKVVLSFLLLVVALVAARSPYVREAVEHGPAPLVDRVRTLIDQDQGESLMDQVAASMKVDTTIRRFRKDMRRDPQKKKEFYTRYCDSKSGNRTPERHKELTTRQQNALCEEFAEQVD